MSGLHARKQNVSGDFQVTRPYAPGHRASYATGAASGPTLLAGAWKTLGCTGVGTSCTVSPRPSSCSARKVSDLAGSYSTVGLWLRWHGRGRGRGVSFQSVSGRNTIERNTLDRSAGTLEGTRKRLVPRLMFSVCF